MSENPHNASLRGEERECLPTKSKASPGLTMACIMSPLSFPKMGGKIYPSSYQDDRLERPTVYEVQIKTRCP